jgi:cytochrome d ubiquinol oxidase subunit I
MTAELGRQPWVVYGLLRTVDASSPTVHAGTALFTLLGFCGLYSLISVLFLFLVAREIGHGPGHRVAAASAVSGPEVGHA